MLILPRRKAGLVVSKLFATTLYTGNGATQTITNGLDLAGKGGLVWGKPRGLNADHGLWDTERGKVSRLASNATSAAASVGGSAGIQSWNADGVTVGSDPSINYSGGSIALWAFCQSPKFFDIVTYTGNDVSGRKIAHNLGVVPGMIVVKRLGTASSVGWAVHHRSTAPNQYLKLNLVDALVTSNSVWASTAPSVADFTLGSNSDVNASGATYVAYLFAHDDSASGIIQCGSYTGNGSTSGPTVTLGWQPQWLLIKRTDSAGDWWIYDDKRDTANPRTAKLLANSSAAEDTSGEDVDFLSTGFQIKDSAAGINASGGTYVYVAIRAPS